MCYRMWYRQMLLSIERAQCDNEMDGVPISVIAPGSARLPQAPVSGTEILTLTLPNKLREVLCRGAELVFLTSFGLQRSRVYVTYTTCFCYAFCPSRHWWCPTITDSQPACSHEGSSFVFLTWQCGDPVREGNDPGLSRRNIWLM